MPEPEFQPGQQIEDYIIGQRLERGGMAELYLARDIVLKRKVIIKVLSPPFSSEAGVQKSVPERGQDPGKP